MSPVTVTATLMLALPAGASPPLNGLLACRHIASNAARLACFDRQSAAIAARMAPAATTTGARPTSSAPAMAASEPQVGGAGVSGATAGHGSALDPVQNFGLPAEQILAREELARRAPRPLAHIRAHIAALASSADGREVFTLDNDQVWRELEPDGDLYAKRGDAVEISRGWLGSYSLSLKSRRTAKVTRVR